MSKLVFCFKSVDVGTWFGRTAVAFPGIYIVSVFLLCNRKSATIVLSCCKKKKKKINFQALHHKKTLKVDKLLGASPLVKIKACIRLRSRHVCQIDG